MTTSNLPSAPESLVSPRKVVADKLSMLHFGEEEKENATATPAGLKSQTGMSVKAKLEAASAQEKTSEPAAAEAVSTASDAPAKQEEQEEEEPILKENPRRFVLFPIQFHDVWQSYKHLEAKFWSAEEIELTEDAEGWTKLSTEEKKFVSFLLSVLSSADSLVGENILERISDELQIPEARCFIGFQIMQKNIHSELFSLLTDILSEDVPEPKGVYAQLRADSSVSNKVQWVQKYLSQSDAPFSHRIIALAAYNVLFLSSTFALGFHMAKSSNHLPGFVSALSKIFMDLNSYFEFYVLIYSLLVKRPSAEDITPFIKEAVAIEKELLSFALKTCPVTSVTGAEVSEKEVSDYVEFVADKILVGFGFSKVYKAENPFAWMNSVVKDDKEGHGASKDIFSVQVRATESAPIKSPVKAQKEEVFFTLDADF